MAEALDALRRAYEAQQAFDHNNPVQLDILCDEDPPDPAEEECLDG